MIRKCGRFYWMDFMINRKRYRLSTKTEDRKLAEKIYHKKRSEVVEGIHFQKPQSHTLGELIGKVYPDKGYAKGLIRFLGANTLITSITPARLSEYKIRSSIRPVAFNREMASLRHAFYLAIKEWEWISNNPVTQVKFIKEPQGRTRYLTIEEEKTLMINLPPQIKSIMVCALNTGMRRSEIMQLKWDDINLIRREIAITHSKNGEKRTIPMNETLLEIFKVPSTGWVFPNSAGNQLDGGKVGKLFRIATKKAGIKNFRFHDLRHTFASRLVQAGVDLYRVQKLLGHKNPAMTMRYSHLSVDNLRIAVSKLSEVHSTINILNGACVNPLMSQQRIVTHC